MRAAGAVVWRPSSVTDQVEVAVVHRPRYDDWSLPKGKLDADETTPAAAVREVLEETGFSIALGRRLPSAEYKVDGSRKVVEYFAARFSSGEFEANDEVDRLKWVSPDAAGDLLRYQHDRVVLAEFAALPARLSTLLLVRHAKAGKRDEWDGDDDLRPLSPSGRRQAEALARVLPLFGADRAFAAPRTRCVDTVAGLGLEIRSEPLLSEEGYWVSPSAGVARLLDIVAAGGTPVVSSQGGVIPDVVARLADMNGVRLDEIASKKGSFWVLSFLPPTSEREPRLVAADYFPSPLPKPSGR
ncbi:NUDIX hydrolase [Kutzneria kofuensis]|uniref:NUDIX hydrolase n=1 Tax=Kutzneria kofuensis TaxID=103725 RepID=UPI00161CF693|nr:NUDIX hydrolase [Kutzneria kofuensis]